MTSRPSRHEQFFSSYEVAPLQLATFRLVFFALLGLDALLEIRHAPRYGAGGFNVSHLPALDTFLPAPSPGIVVAILLLIAFLAFRIALNRPGRAALPVLTALYAYRYLISQLDSYQHHYLILLLLFVLCFVPWSRKAFSLEPRHWSLRLLLLQCSVVYFWAAVAKLNPVWLDGTTLHAQVQGTRAGALVVATVGWALASKLVVVLELLLAFTIHWPRARGLAALLGIGFHLGIEWTGFEIGLFSYFMVALYLLVLPPAWWVRRPFRRQPGLGQDPSPSPSATPHQPSHATGTRRSIAFGLAVFSALPIFLIPLPYAKLVATVVLVSGLLWVQLAKPSIMAVAGHFASALLLSGLVPMTGADVDFYRFSGGADRRLGDFASAAKAYEQAVELRPDARSVTALGRIYRLAGRFDEALVEFRRAQAMAPDDPRSFLGEAQLHHQLGRGAEAVAAAGRALALDGDLREARSIRDDWERQGHATP